MNLLLLIYIVLLSLYNPGIAHDKFRTPLLIIFHEDLWAIWKEYCKEWEDYKIKDSIIRRGITKWEFDIFGIAETNIDWRLVDEDMRLYSTTRQ
jgi:hypothetical protein